jgi:cytochrome P450
MMQIVFCKNFNTLTHPKFRYVIDALQLSHTRIGVLAWSPILASLKLDRVLLLKSLIGAKAFLTFMYQLLKEKLDAPCSPPSDIFSYLIRPPLHSGQQAPRKSELYAEAPLLIVGASDTTATALAALFYYLSRYPKAYSRVLDEVRNTFSHRDQVRMGATLNSCSYLRACINEALRLCPPISGPLLREVPYGGLIIDGMFVPGSYEVGVSPYAIQRNPEFFPNPQLYDPERWLGKDADPSATEKVARSQSAFMPFSVGSRSCVGQKLGTIEIMIITSRMLLEFDFEATDLCRDLEELPDYKIFDHLNAMKDGPMIQFHKRVSILGAEFKGDEKRAAI